MQIAIANNKDISSLINIWRRCFVDDIVFLEQFFKKCFPLSRTYVYKEKGIIISGISLFCLSYISDKERLNSKGVYLYGVCTLPEYRGKHLTASLIDYAEEESRTRGYSFMITRPATASLFALYRKLGFNKPIYRKYVDLPLPIISDGIAYSEPNSTRLKELRSKYLKSNYFEWDDAMLDYIIYFYKLGRGIVAELESDRYMIGYPDIDDASRFNILEMGVYSKSIKYPSYHLIGTLIKAKNHETTKARLYFPFDKSYDDLADVEKEVFALLKPISSEIDPGAFFNFSME